MGRKVDDAEALRLHACGWTDRKIAARFGVTSECIALIRRNRGLLPNVGSMSLRGQRGMIAQARQRGLHELAATWEKECGL